MQSITHAKLNNKLNICLTKCNIQSLLQEQKLIILEA